MLTKRLRCLIPHPRTRFAQKAGIQYKALDAYLRGAMPPPEVLAQIARALNMSVDELLAVPPASVPVVGRAAAGPLVTEESAREDRTVVLEVAGFRVTIRVEPIRP